MRFLHLFLFILNFSPILCDDFPVHSSQLEVIMYNNNDIEFQLKNRKNVSVKDINPTSTFSKIPNFVPEGDVTSTKMKQKQFEGAPVPLIMSVYAYDKGAVEVLRTLMELRPKNMTFLQWNLIKK